MIEKKCVAKGMESFARYSDCGGYRYSLMRTWNPQGKKVLFIGLNPSTATEIKNDPTITRMINFSKNFGFGSMSVCNLFSFRATFPSDLKQAKDPIGHDNDQVIQEEMERADLVIAAWGNHGTFMDRSLEVVKSLEKFSHFGFTKLGEPKHVLYLRSDSKLFEVGTK